MKRYLIKSHVTYKLTFLYFYIAGFLSILLKCLLVFCFKWPSNMQVHTVYVPLLLAPLWSLGKNRNFAVDAEEL